MFVFSTRFDSVCRGREVPDSTTGPAEVRGARGFTGPCVQVWWCPTWMPALTAPSPGPGTGAPAAARDSAAAPAPLPPFAVLPPCRDMERLATLNMPASLRAARDPRTRCLSSVGRPSGGLQPLLGAQCPVHPHCHPLLRCFGADRAPHAQRSRNVTTLVRLAGTTIPWGAVRVSKTISCERRGRPMTLRRHESLK